MYFPGKVLEAAQEVLYALGWLEQVCSKTQETPENADKEDAIPF